LSYVGALFVGMFVFLPRWGCHRGRARGAGAALASTPVYLPVRRCIGIPMRAVVAAVRPAVGSGRRDGRCGARRIAAVPPPGGLINDIVLLIAFGAGSAAIYIVTPARQLAPGRAPSGAEAALLDRLGGLLWRRR
jgi:hypothetical protein